MSAATGSTPTRVRALMRVRLTRLEPRKAGGMMCKDFFYQRFCQAAKETNCKFSGFAECCDRLVCCGPES
ncbi:MAG: nitrogen fixation protein NifQ [Sterolibacteriaceae bacterium]|nr:nitrogen fixation protein NifQ [Sterolibacteriaceae bacterium]